MNIALFQPQIPPNTGNIIRLCANSGAKLHLIHPLGFPWDDKRLRRAGLDYQEFAEISHYENWLEFRGKMADARIWALTTKGQNNVYDTSFTENDVLLFGSETSGLSAEIHQSLADQAKLRLPMQAHSRSMNLSNTVAIVLYEALRQTGFQFASEDINP